VARFTLAEFDRLFRGHGLTIEEVYGTYAFGAYDVHTSPHLILVARKAPRGYFRCSWLRIRLTVSGDKPRYDATIHCGTRWAIVGKVRMKSR
jgi:hypothetical protein